MDVLGGDEAVGPDDGLDQDELTYLHLGRRERLTEIQGRVMKELV